MPQHEKLRLIRARKGKGYLSKLCDTELEQFTIIEHPDGQIEGWRKFFLDQTSDVPRIKEGAI